LIHDYHLLLLPSLLREMGLNNRIGFFLHTPFPLPETLSKWRYRQPLLESLAQVDVLGMQTDRDANNFNNSLAETGISMRKGAVIKAFPIGIDYKAFHSAWKIKSVGKYIKSLGKLVAGKRVILSVSRLDYTKGIVEQILAIQSILYKYKPGKIIYKLVVAPSRESIKEYVDLKEQIDNTVNEVNALYKKKFGIEPIQYEYRSFGFEELNAWYRIADVLLIAPRQDGMNLIVKEYIAAHEGYSGTVVLSKTIGAAQQLKEALLVDPLSMESIAKGIKRALDMPLNEKMRRWKSLKDNVRQENVFWWARTFLRELTRKDL
jgi:trehalose 6-phosphate synthase/phosphatase